ncbi:DUF6082 family protein [Streptomyces sp. NBC_00828]|uniref:DUF6082 family protein n=1 Tax=Streptomyces sp. NBC_00828 TaxID=2903678 RepID=UPI00386B1FE8
MAHFLTRRSTVRFCMWLVAAALGIALTCAASVVVSGWLISGVERADGGTHAAAERGAVGDYFGGMNAVFSGLALLLLIVTLFYQQRELRLQRQELSMQREELAASREELRRSAEADMRSLHMQLTQMVMADPPLAEVWNDFPGEPDSALRQNLFANLTFNHFVLAHSWGNQPEASLLVHARNLLRSPAFRRYWAATRSHKSELPPETAEGQVFQAFERAFAELDGGTPPPTA